MSRYEQKVNKKNFYIKIILILVVVLVFIIWMYQQNEQVETTETKKISLPIKKSLSPVEKPISLAGNNENERVSEQVQAVDTFGVIESNQSVSLDNSDDNFLLAIGDVAPDLDTWFKVKDVIRKYIVLINGLSQKQLLYKHRKFLKSPQKMMVKTDSQGLFLAPESYHRFDNLTEAIVSIDVDKGLALYLAFRPLFVQVYNQFAYPTAYNLEDIFLKAAANVIDAPVVEKRIPLLKHSIRYKYADQKLESLNDIEKQMLRMGPENTKKIQSKLRLLVEAISTIDEL